MTLLSVAEAHVRLMALFAPLATEEVPLAAVAGRVLARPVVAQRAQPPFDASAMDGYALRAADAPGPIRIIGAAQAGSGLADPLRPGEAARIYTGAPVPGGADCVAIQEEAEAQDGVLRLTAPVRPGDNIRPAGGDFPAGAQVTSPRRIGPGDMALIAAMNAGTVTVVRRPVVALIPTGDELTPPGSDAGPYQIATSNNFGLKALLETAGAEARLLPIARDTPDHLASVLALAAGADLIVTLGGASVGDFDLVRRTATERGLALDFHKVALRPGKPLLAGMIDGTPLIGLPGNPVSAMVCGRVFVVPAVERMLGLPGDPPAPLAGRLAAAVGANGPRTHYMRARVVAEDGGFRVTPALRQDSSLLSILSESNALLIRPPQDPARHANDKVEFIWLW